jgi:DNA repair exonuclease SbcCD ATPase subunit
MQRFSDLIDVNAERKNRVVIAADLQEVEGSIETLKSREARAQEMIAILKVRIEELRGVRRQILVAGESTAKIDKETTALELDMKDQEDLLIGLGEGDHSLRQLKERAASMREALLEADERIAFAEMYVRYDEYNAKAAALAETVRGLYASRVKVASIRDRRRSFNDRLMGIFLGHFREASGDSTIGALESIPKLVQGGASRDASFWDRKFESRLGCVR